jgi:NHLM bacteriocin system ABC transporter ATP-binding protein
MVTDFLGAAPPAKISREHAENPHDRIKVLARHAGMRIRQVALRGSWWQDDNGPLIGFLQKDSCPVALLPETPRRYNCFDPVTGTSELVSRKSAENLQPFAYMLYRTLPGRILNGRDLLAFGIRGSEPDLLMIVAMGLGESLLSLLVPIVTGIVFNSSIPQARIGQLWLLCAALLLSTACSSVFGLSRSIAILRFEGRIDQSIQAAVWDRLLKLPPSFFRKFSTGDLADRSMGISAIRQTLSGTVILSIMSGVFSVSNLILLFYYSVSLAVMGLLLSGLAVLVLVTGSLLQLRYQKNLAGLHGRISGMVLGFITGIAKFRVSGSEERAFARWAALFGEKKQNAQKVRMIDTVINSFSESFPLLASSAIFILIVTRAPANPLSTGDFLAFSVAFAQFFGALMLLCRTSMALVGIVPHFQRCRPIIEAIPEAGADKEDPGELYGKVEVSRLSFRYTPHTPLVLDDISLRVKPGEFVAIAGSSGSGKSTLVRLLLGFETQDSGAILYDGKDLKGLNVCLVRRKIGVVLQNGRILAGDILTNIVGSSHLSIDDAWAAARMAGMEDDIRSFPMGMHTFISEGGGNLSGGQRQRLLIARAIVMKPALLILDEATSALDNRTQALVNEHLEKLGVTRIVIAHRLSTIMKADTILVFDKGKIVQRGTYAQLMNEEGLFSELARRQITL